MSYTLSWNKNRELHIAIIIKNDLAEEKNGKGRKQMDSQAKVPVLNTTTSFTKSTQCPCTIFFSSDTCGEIYVFFTICKLKPIYDYLIRIGLENYG